MRIRPEQELDRPAIADVTARAFAEVAHSDRREPQIIASLRAAGALSLSLVAEEQRRIIGHIAFSPVTIDGAEQRWLGLGPVSVAPARQRGGIGSALIRDGLDRLRSRGAAGCVVLGDPGFYGRFGFEPAATLRYEGASPRYFMRLCFSASAPAGLVEYHPGFGGP